MSNKAPTLVTKMDVLQNALRQTIGIKNDGLNTTNDKSIIFTTYTPINFTCQIKNHVYGVSYHKHTDSFVITMKNITNGKYLKIISLEKYDTIVSLFKYFKTR